MISALIYCEIIVTFILFKCFSYFALKITFFFFKFGMSAVFLIKKTEQKIILIVTYIENGTHKFVF